MRNKTKRSTLPGASSQELSADSLPDLRSTETIAQSEAHFRAIFENAKEGFVLIDREGTILIFNSVAEKCILLNHGASPAKVGDSIYDHILPERKTAFKEIIKTVLEGEQVQYDRPYKTEYGTLWFNISLNGVKMGDTINAVSITGMDITARKEAETIAEKNQQFLRTIIENSTDAVTIFSEDGTKIFGSSSIKNILGYSEEEALTLALEDLIHPDDKEATYGFWENALGNPGKTITGHNTRVLHKNGTWRFLNLDIKNLLDDPIVRGVVCNYRDITEQLRGEETLRLTTERYKHLFDNNPLPMWIFDPKTYKILEVNNVAIAKYGYSKEEFLNLTIKDIRPASAVKNLVASMKGRMNRQYNFSGTWEHLTKDGTVIDVEIASHTIMFEGKEAILVLANDVTEKKKATKMLLKVYQEKSNILESIRDGFFTLDKDWNFTYINKEAERLLHIKREDVLSRNIWEIFKAAVPLKFFTETKKAVENNIAITFEEYFPPLDMWINSSVYPSEEGLSVYFKDVTERKRVEDRISSAKERYEIVARATNHAIYEWDIVNNRTFWGEGYQTIFGHQRSDEHMPPESWFDNLHPDEKDDILEVAEKALREQQPSLSREMRFRCADGSYKTVLDKLIIVYDDNGAPAKIIGAMQDITERKKSEEAVRKLNEQLNEHAIELAKSNEELERFAYVASHDLQEPLRMVSSFLQLLQKKYEAQLDEKANQYINFAVDGADRMKRLILDLLEYSRVGTNKDKLVPTDMNEVAAQMLQNFSNRITEKEASIQIGELPVVNGNRTQLTQLLQNLVSNALKYNTSFVPEVEIGCTEEEDCWKFHVKDNGIGIDPKFADKIFIIFQRLHNRNQFSGTGVGLAICKKIIEKHGGKIWIDSKPGEGSTFFFTIKK